jgi:hypothetical protein
MKKRPTGRFLMAAISNGLARPSNKYADRDNL